MVASAAAVGEAAAGAAVEVDLAVEVLVAASAEEVPEVAAPAAAGSIADCRLVVTGC